ncbi:hypothetical protein [Metapseudomonas furukawaii]
MSTVASRDEELLVFLASWALRVSAWAALKSKMPARVRNAIHIKKTPLFLQQESGVFFDSAWS